MLVFVEDSAESVVAVNVQVCQRGGFGDRFRQRLLGSGVGDAAVWPVPVVMVFVLAEGVQQVLQPQILG
jgi:hypothetical protein